MHFWFISWTSKMGFSAWSTLALLMTRIALVHGRIILKFRTRKGGVDLLKKGIDIYRGKLIFSMSTCKTANIALSTRTDTVRSAPDYKIVFNEIDSSGGVRTVLYHWDKRPKASKSVMILKQTESLCRNSHWFYVEFSDSSFRLSDTCDGKKIFSWDSLVKEKLRAALISSEDRATWAFVTDEKAYCSSTSGKPKDFLSLASLVLKTSRSRRSQVVQSDLFEFKSMGKIFLSYQTCQKAYFILSSNTDLKEYYTLSLAYRNAQSKTTSIILSRLENNRTDLIGSPLKTVDPCRKPSILHIYWSKNRIGAGSSCDPSAGTEWEIDSRKEFRFLTLNSVENQGSSKWKLAKDNCDVRYSQKITKPSTLTPHKGSSSSSKSSPKPHKKIPGSGIAISSQTSLKPKDTPFVLTTPWKKSTAKYFGSDPVTSSETLFNVLNTASNGKCNEQNSTPGPRSEASPIKFDMAILLVFLIPFCVK